MFIKGLLGYLAFLIYIIHLNAFPKKKSMCFEITSPMCFNSHSLFQIPRVTQSNLEPAKEFKVAIDDDGDVRFLSSATDSKIEPNKDPANRPVKKILQTSFVAANGQKVNAQIRILNSTDTKQARKSIEVQFSIPEEGQEANRGSKNGDKTTFAVHFLRPGQEDVLFDFPELIEDESGLMKVETKSNGTILFDISNFLKQYENKDKVNKITITIPIVVDIDEMPEKTKQKEEVQYNYHLFQETVDMVISKTIEEIYFSEVQKGKNKIFIDVNDYKNSNGSNGKNSELVIEIRILEPVAEPKDSSKPYRKNIAIIVFKPEFYEESVRNDGADQIDAREIIINLPAEGTNKNGNQLKIKMHILKFIKPDAFNKNQNVGNDNENIIIINPEDLKSLEEAIGRKDNKIPLDIQILRPMGPKRSPSVDLDNRIILSIQAYGRRQETDTNGGPKKSSSTPITAVVNKQTTIDPGIKNSEDLAESSTATTGSKHGETYIEYTDSLFEKTINMEISQTIEEIHFDEIKKGKNKIFVDINNSKKTSDTSKDLIIEIRILEPLPQSKQSPKPNHKKIAILVFKPEFYDENLRNSGADQIDKREIEIRLPAEVTNRKDNQLKIGLHVLKFLKADAFNKNHKADDNNVNKIILTPDDLQQLEKALGDKNTKIPLYIKVLKPMKPKGSPPVPLKNSIIVQIEAYSKGQGRDDDSAHTNPSPPPKEDEHIDIDSAKNGASYIEYTDSLFEKTINMVISQTIEEIYFDEIKKGKNKIFVDIDKSKKTNDSSKDLIIEIRILEPLPQSKQSPKPNRNKVAILVLKPELYDENLRNNGADRIDERDIEIRLPSKGTNRNDNQLKIALHVLKFTKADAFNKNRKADDNNGNKIILSQDDLQQLEKALGDKNTKIPLYIKVLKPMKPKGSPPVNLNNQIIVQIEAYSKGQGRDDDSAHTSPSSPPKDNDNAKSPTTKPGSDNEDILSETITPTETATVPVINTIKKNVEKTENNKRENINSPDNKKGVVRIFQETIADEITLNMEILRTIKEIYSDEIQESKNKILVDVNNYNKSNDSRDNNEESFIMEVSVFKPVPESKKPTKSSQKKIVILVFKPEFYQESMRNIGADKIYNKTIILNLPIRENTKKSNQVRIDMRVLTFHNENALNRKIDEHNINKIVINPEYYENNKNNAINIYIPIVITILKPVSRNIGASVNLTNRIILEIQALNSNNRKDPITVQVTDMKQPANKLPMTGGDVFNNPFFTSNSYSENLNKKMENFINTETEVGEGYLNNKTVVKRVGSYYKNSTNVYGNQPNSSSWSGIGNGVGAHRSSNPFDDPFFN